MSQVKFVLTEADLPKQWYNVLADLPFQLPPPLHPATSQPIGPTDLAPLFPFALILQEVSQDRMIDIPEPVRDVYRQWRPSPLYRARRLEKVGGTSALAVGGVIVLFVFVGLVAGMTMGAQALRRAEAPASVAVAQA